MFSTEVNYDLPLIPEDFSLLEPAMITPSQDKYEIDYGGNFGKPLESWTDEALVYTDTQQLCSYMDQEGETSSLQTSPGGSPTFLDYNLSGAADSTKRA